MKTTLRTFCLSLALVLAALACGGAPSAPSESSPSRATRATTSTSSEQGPTAADEARAIRLEGALNVRDLGGLHGRRGPIPRGSFVRSADLSHATPADWSLLVERGVGTDLDLRGASEIAKAPDATANQTSIRYVNVALLGEEPFHPERYKALGDIYVEALAQSQEPFKRVFQTLAAQSEGAVLYHCSAGKDRTGMVTAILLSLAGVDREAIVHDYAISASYLVSKEGGTRNPAYAYLIGSPPSEMHRFLTTLDEDYGGAHAYLRRIGVSDADIAALERRLGQ